MKIYQYYHPKIYYYYYNQINNNYNYFNHHHNQLLLLKSTTTTSTTTTTTNTNTISLLSLIEKIFIIIMIIIVNNYNYNRISANYLDNYDNNDDELISTLSLSFVNNTFTSSSFISPLFPSIKNDNIDPQYRRKRSSKIMSHHNLHRHHHQHHPHYLNIQQQQQYQHNPYLNRPESLSMSTRTMTTTTIRPTTTTTTAYHNNNNNYNQRIVDSNSRRQHNEWHSGIQHQQQTQHQSRLSPDWLSRKRSHQSSSPLLLYNYDQSTLFKNGYHDYPISSISSHQNQQQQKHQQLQLQYQRFHQQKLQQQQQCPDGPPEQWSNRLDVSGKALLSPIIIHGELISLAEDYGGRIGATFRLLKLIKPNINNVKSLTLLNWNNDNNSNNNNNISKLLSNLDMNNNNNNVKNNNNYDEYEIQIKLNFVRQLNESMEQPFCALYWPNIWEKLRTKTKYILFVHEQILSQRGFLIPTSTLSFSTSDKNNENQQPNNSHNHHHHNHHRIGHQLITMIPYTLPEILSRNTSRLVRKILCRNCAKPARIINNNNSRDRIDIQAKQNITITCRVDGNPIPWIEWYRNGKQLKQRRRVIINTQRRISQLTIMRSSIRRDNGQYECRAMNVVSKEPSVKRFYVNVQWKIKKKFLNKKYSNRKQQTTTNTSSKSLSTKTPNTLTISSPTNSNKNQNDNNNLIISANNNNNNNHHYNINFNEDSDEIIDDNQNNDQNNSEIPQPCPISTFCLNGATCSLYKHLGEYVCECADGYNGYRCEYKDLQKYPVKTLVDYDPVVARQPPSSSQSSSASSSTSYHHSYSTAKNTGNDRELRV